MIGLPEDSKLKKKKKTALPSLFAIVKDGAESS